MKVGKYKIKFSERAKHYVEIIGGLFFTAVMIISISAVVINIVTAEYDNLKVTHIYEDNCIDIYNKETEDYYFYCEDTTFYGEN